VAQQYAEDSDGRRSVGAHRPNYDGELAFERLESAFELRVKRVDATIDDRQSIIDRSQSIFVSGQLFGGFSRLIFGRAGREQSIVGFSTASTPLWFTGSAPRWSSIQTIAGRQ
jgi:hypothetical protein